MWEAIAAAPAASVMSMFGWWVACVEVFDRCVTAYKHRKWEWRSGADIYVLQKVLGHREIATTIDRYGHLYDDEIDELGESLDAALNGSHGQNMATK